ncbi:MAG: hypothetical protein JO117_08260 [Verrucomicrobia bacterium]|nr:hypothetical protein [Verrucomicrobiota bacterium]MBV9657828.1 hypothetical protein [Verrucomicrobiota bacterium]
MRNQHVWREVTPEGAKREVRAVKFAGRWKLQARLGREPEWTYYDLPLLADLHALRDLIWRKYQRRRASYDDVTSLDRLISEQQRRESPRVAGETVSESAQN